MNRLRQPGDSDYDVLGISPGASDDEINSAFSQLIDGQGYKVGIPLNRQWLRAHQIKTAHATLSDPAMRRAYDESLSRASDGALWGTTADDPATDRLVVPKIEAEAATPVENGPAPDTVLPDEVLTGSGPEQAPDRIAGPEPEEAVGSVNETPLPQDPSPPLSDDEADFALASNDNRRASVRNWGVATAVACGLGLVLISSWPASERQLSTNEGTPGVTADRWQASGAGRGLVQQPAHASGNLGGAAASGREAQGAPGGDSPAASGALDRPSDVQGASNVGSAPDIGELAPTEQADVQSPAATPPPGTVPAAAEPSSRPEEAAEARAIAPDPTARADDAAALQSGDAAAGSVSGPIPVAAQWIGGGPTDADNPSGRYEGSVAVQVTVEPGGRVSNCAPVRGSGNAGLDALTCRLVQERARFTPALDEQGRPVVSQAYTTFFWGRRRRN